MRSWTSAQLRHAFHVFRYGKYPAATVYESLGEDVFGAFERGWLNLGLWNDHGDESEAAIAPRRLVETICAGLSGGGCVVDVGNGLGAQDEVIRDKLKPDLLIAVNISHFQLRAGEERLARARARPIVADATRLPLATESTQTLLCVEAAFHFASRSAFFAEARRVLCSGGAISMSDIVVKRSPRGVLEVLAGLWTLRFWGLSKSAIATADEVVGELAQAGFTHIDVTPCGDRVIDPALRVIRERFRKLSTVPRLQKWAGRLMVAQWQFLRRRGLPEYILVRAIAGPKLHEP